MSRSIMILAEATGPKFQLVRACTVPIPTMAGSTTPCSTVATEIAATRKGRPLRIKVDYVLHKAGGALRAYDIKTDGVSLVENYRAQFDKLVAKGGIDNLLTKMRKKAPTT